MIPTINKIYELLDTEKNKIIPLILLFLFLSMFDLLGISIIAPYINLINNQDSESLESLKYIHSFFRMEPDFKNTIIITSLIFIFIFFLKAVISIIAHRLIIKFGFNQRLRLTDVMLNNYYNMSYLSFIERNSADYIKTIDSFTSAYAAIVNKILKMISDFMVALVIIMFLIFRNPFAVIILIFFTLFLAIIYERYFRLILKNYSLKVVETSIDSLKNLKHSIEGFKVNVIFDTFSFFHKKTMFETKTHLNVLLNQMTISNSPRYIYELIIIVFFVSFVSVLVFNDNSNNIISTLGVLAFASMRLIPIASFLLSSIQGITFDEEIMDRLHIDYFNLKTKAKNKNNLKNFKFNKFKMSNVEFSYNKENEKNINNTSFEFNRGDSIGFIGSSGAGKTTLIDLMLGLIKPQKGNIKIDNYNINNVLHKWQNQIAYLPQESFLIDDTLEQNIALGIDKEKINQDLLKISLEKSNLLDLINQLPEGVKTIIGERGSKISGGQQQRISIARALYHERDIIVLDESTSSLDNETEVRIVEELKNLKGEKTLIFISHRLSTLKYYDRIYKLKNGKIIDSGNFNDLKKLN